MEEETKAGSGEGEQKPIVDAFGMPNGNAPVEQAPVDDGKGEGKGEGEGDGKGDGKGAEDITKHPEFVKLQGTINTLSENLKGQNEVIGILKGQLGKDTKGGKDDGASDLFKDIKTSKDLSKEERDEMSESELKMFDDNATLKQSMNQLARMIAGISEKTAEKPVDGSVDVEKVSDLNSEARSEALALAGNDLTKANNILAKFNLFGGNEKLTRSQLKERMNEAFKLTPDFKPAKEQESKPNNGTAVKKNDTSADPFGAKAVVEKVRSNNTGTYGL